MEAGKESLSACNYDLDDIDMEWLKSTETMRTLKKGNAKKFFSSSSYFEPTPDFFIAEKNFLNTCFYWIPASIDPLPKAFKGIFFPVDIVTLFISEITVYNHSIYFSSTFYWCTNNGKSYHLVWERGIQIQHIKHFSHCSIPPEKMLDVSFYNKNTIRL